MYDVEGDRGGESAGDCLAVEGSGRVLIQKTGDGEDQMAGHTEKGTFSLKTHQPVDE